MSSWEKRTYKLKKHHGWRAKPGYRIFVADHGAVRFDFPQDWVMVPDSDSVKFYDRQPPDDNCRLTVSYFRLPPIDWSGLPLPQLIEEVVEDDPRNTLTRKKTVQVQRHNLEIAWTEISFIDPEEGREAYSRICLGRGSNIQSLITFDFWADDLDRLSPVWDEVISTLVLGLYIKDPTGWTIN